MDAKERKRHDRFNGLSEEEVSRRTLPDHLASNLDVVIVSSLSSIEAVIHEIRGFIIFDDAKCFMIEIDDS
jgi:hypothetical protein